MPSIAELRNMYPDAKNASDEEIIGWVAKRSNISLPDAARYFDYDLSGGQTSKRFGASIDRYQAGLYGTGEALAGAVGLDSTSNYLAKQRQQNEAQANISSGRAKELGAVESFKDVNSIGDFGNYAVGLGIQSAPYLGEALAGGVIARGAMTGTRAALTAAEAAGDVAAAARAKRALNIGSSAGVAAASYPSAVGDVLSSQREQAGKTDAASAFALGVPYAALNVLGVEGALARGQLFRNSINFLDNVSGAKGVLARTTATGTVAAGKEGAQETLQETVNQAGRMAVDPTEQFFNEKSIERFKESFAGGATLGGLIGGGAGGWRRSESFIPGSNTSTNQQTGQPAANDIQQVFQQTNTGTTPTNTGAPPTAIPVNRLDNQTSATTVDPLTGGGQTTPPITPSAPAVSGGTTDIAQAQAATQQQQQQQTQAEFAAQQQQKEVERAEFMADRVGLPRPDGQRWDFFGKPIFGPAVQEAAKATADLVGAMNGTQNQITRAINIANDQTGGKLVNVPFNPLKAADSVRKTFEKVAEAAARFQIAHVGSAEEAAQILEQLSQSTKGAQLEQLNAIHQALTGQDTTGYIASQQTKGATNAQQQQQTTTGVGAVPVQGGAGEVSSGVAGNVQPGRLQSLISGSQPQGQTSQQTGQPSGEGIRPSTSVTPNISGGQLTTGQVSDQAPATQAAVSSAAPVITEQTIDEDTGAVPGQSQEQPDEEQRVQEVPNLIRNALRMIFKSDRKVDLLLFLTEKSNRGNYGELAKQYGVTEDYVKELAAQATVAEGETHPPFIINNIDKFYEAVKFQAEKMNISLLEALEGLEAIHETYQLEETNIVEEADLQFNAGLQIQNRSERTDVKGKKTGKSDLTNTTNIVDENNKSDTLNQKYTVLMEEMVKALEANDESKVTKLQTEIADVVGKIRKEVKLEQGRTRAKAGKVKAEKEEKALTGEVSPTGEDIGERATTTEADEKVEAAPKEQLAEEEVEAEQEEEIKPKSLGEKLAEESSAKRKVERKGLAVGDTVVNPKLGTGVVEGFSGNGAETIVTVKFQSGVTKNLSVALAKLEKTNAVQVDSGKAVVKEEIKPAKPAQARKASSETKTTHRVTYEGKAATVTIVRNKATPEKIEAVTVKPDGERFALINLGAQGVVSDEKMLASMVEGDIIDAVTEPTLEVKTPEEAAEAAWNKVADTMPSAPKFADLTKAQRDNFIDFGSDNWTEADVTLELVKLAKAAPAAPATEIVTEKRQTIEDIVAEETVEQTEPVVEAAVEELTAEEIIEESPEAAEINPEQQAILEEPVAALPEAQVVRLENHYGVKRGTSAFFTKLQEDVTAYATKGAQAVAAAIRDIVRAIHAGVLATAMIFNPSVMTKNSEVVIIAPRTVSQVKEVRAEVPAAAKANMSKAAQEAYSTIYPSIAAKLKADNKFFVLTDKPNAQMFIFSPDGSLFLQKKVLIGKTVGDYYKGNTDIVQNRITPAGLFTMGLRDAQRGGGEARTAGDYDFGKVFVLDKAIGGEYSVTLFHSVYTKEKDAQQRLAALQKQGAADSRYSFGCINVDKATYGSLVTNNLQQMDGAALFIVPDKQELVGEFLTGATAQNKSNKDELTRTPFTPKTETVTTTTPAPASGQATTSKTPVVGREQQGPLAARGNLMEFDDVDSQLGGMDLVREQLEQAGISNALDYVSDWEVVNDPAKDAIHGEIRAEGGRYVVALNAAKLGNAQYAAQVVRHELSHAVDMAPHGGIYSAQTEMGLLVKDGKITPTGAVAQEMYNLYQSDPDWKDFLAYPFDTKLYPELNNGTKVQIELFAQIMAAYTNPVGKAELERVAPRTAAYLKEVVNDIKSTKSLQIQKAETAAIRAVGFQNRNKTGRNQPATGLPPKARVEETGPLAAKGTGLSLDQTLDRLPPFVRTSTRSLTTTLLNQAKNAVYASAITEDVVKMASKYMRSANDYLNAQYARQATRIQFEQRINKILSDFDKLSGEYKGTGANSVNKFIKDSTVSGKWGYYPGEQRVGTELFVVDPDMKLRFDAFDESAQNVIKDVFEHGYEALMLKKKAVEAAIDREFADREKAVMGDTEQIAELAKEKKLLLAREAKVRGINVSSPYAYLGRYGDYVVVAKSAEFKYYEERAKLNDWDVKQAKQWLQDNISNADHYVVQFAETQAEADVIADQLHATGNYDIMPEDAGVKEAEESYTGGGDIHLAVSRLRNLLQRQVSEGDISSVNFHSMNKMVGDLYLMTVAEASARKSEMQRKNVAGADDNMMRNLATSGRADAHFLSTLEHNDDITDSMERMRSEAKNHRREAMPIYNELIKRQANSMEYTTPAPLSIALNRMNTLWSLTFSPAYYMQQILQTAVISVPYLAGRLGYSNAVSQVNRGYKDIASLVKGLGVNDNIDFSKAPADVRDMLNKLVGMGKIDISMDANERATADEKGIFAKVMYKMQGVNNRIESVNRSVAAIAAYRGYLARYGNNNTEAATQYAAQVVSDTHGSYDGFNTPRILAGNIGRVVGQFRRFQIIQLSMLARLMNNAFKGASADEKMVARKALGFITAQMAVIGGAMAVPFVSQIAWMMSKIFGDPDEPDNFEFKLRRLIDNKVVSDLLLRGVPAALGVDVSDKLGMGRVASILPFSQGDLTSRSGAEKILVAAMGPSASMSMKFADAFGMILKGDYYKGLEMAMPNGFANVMKAGRFTTEGITMRNGDLVLKPEDFSVVDTAFQAVGLPTNTVTDRQFTQQVKAEYDKFYAQRSTDIKGDYVKAYRNNDAKGMSQAREEFQQMEDSRVANGYKRQPMSDLLRAPMAAMKRERGVIGGVETSKQNRRFVELASQI
jgi:hypothetical protein